MLNKTIYMTYKKTIPKFVFDRWTKLNSNYTIDFSLDDQCITFLRDNFNDYIADLFINIPKGMYKADLWRLCKLYINGGVYADVDLVPYINIDKFLENKLFENSNVFISCLSALGKSIFQAFMICKSEPKNPLILNFLLSFLQNNPYNYNAGKMGVLHPLTGNEVVDPTYDMYNCLTHSINNNNLITENIYNIQTVNINIKIGKSIEPIKKINLYYIPIDIEYTTNIKLDNELFNDKFECYIENNILIVKNKSNIGWNELYDCDIIIKYNIDILLLKEIFLTRNHDSACVIYKNRKILQSRDPIYFRRGGW
jgi:hypothetical protein